MTERAVVAAGVHAFDVDRCDAVAAVGECLLHGGSERALAAGDQRDGAGLHLGVRSVAWLPISRRRLDELEIDTIRVVEVDAVAAAVDPGRERHRLAQGLRSVCDRADKARLDVGDNERQVCGADAVSLPVGRLATRTHVLDQLEDMPRGRRRLRGELELRHLEHRVLVADERAGVGGFLALSVSEHESDAVAIEADALLDVAYAKANMEDAGWVERAAHGVALGSSCGSSRVSSTIKST